MRKNLVKALKFITISAIICVSFVVSSQKTTAASAINRAINYQGRLLNANGIPVSDGNYSLKFSLYDAVSGGNTLWTASGATSSPAAVSVTVTSGLFSYNLGDTSTGQNAFDFDWNQNSLFLGVTVASDSEMSPRKRLTAVPYAFVAETLQGQYASSSVTSTGGNLFALRQNSANAATSDRTVLFLQTSGTSNVFDYFVKATNGTDVFTVSRQGHTTTTGNFATNGNSILGNDTSDNLTVNARINSDLIPTSDNTFLLGNSTLRWKGIDVVNVTSTNATTTNFYATNATIASINFTNVTTTNLSVTNINGNLIPLANNAFDIGTSTQSWRNIYASGTLSLGGAATVASMLSTGRVQALDLLFGSTGNLLLSSESVTAASTTVGVAASFGATGDRAMIAREFILTGSTLGPIGTQTLSLIESPTSTLKVTNGSSGWGSIQAQNVTANGSVTSSYLEFTSASGSSLLLNSLTVAN
ncbi:MAG: hypothetical protein AAB386_01730, partial [Patescibacteria group bacterium]